MTSNNHNPKAENTNREEGRNPEGKWFGQRAVNEEEKAGLVRGVFDSVADNYDVMNDAMSFGIHRPWKDALVKMIRPRPGLAYLDVAGGTGDIGFRIKKRLRDHPETKITFLDINHNMLSVGRDRAMDKGYGTNDRWICGDAEALPFPDNSQDVYTIAFGLRNVTRIDKALQEAQRVLKPGGRFFCLEFSKVQVPGMDTVYDLYSRHMIPRLGEMIANDRESYQYLIESIRKFPTQEQLRRRIHTAGLKRCRVRNLTFGVAAIHSAVKA